MRYRYDGRYSEWMYYSGRDGSRQDGRMLEARDTTLR